ncbi:Malonyl-CoA O-methyltransferase BioC [Madurella fahalii]|uniref:Malonyl-CoA O-methyltransferase BioC n=1 Tax=Madurella fahalii TaxID=1157608 RepID=A0ABQ0G508_9PEZI
MAQNIYDNLTFFENYSLLKRSIEGLSGAPEWPRLRSFLPPLQDTHILDLGCGMGWYAPYFSAQGASSVRGIDLSQNMLARARSMNAASNITYVLGDLDSPSSQPVLLPDSDTGNIDVVFSALAVHYLTHLPELVAHIHRVLKPGGVFIFSAEHPILTAPSGPGPVEIDASDHPGDAGRTRKTVWPLNDYQKEGERVTDWLADGVKKYHRTTASYVNILLKAGFELTGFDEWYPTEEEFEEKPEWREEMKSEMMKPTFLLVRARKKENQNREGLRRLG